MANVTVPMWENADGDGHHYEDPGVPHTVVSLEPPHRAVLNIEEFDNPMSVEDMILSVASFDELKDLVQKRRDRANERAQQKGLGWKSN